VEDDLTFAFHLADVADGIAGAWVRRGDVTVRRKVDGSQLTPADVATVEALHAPVAVLARREAPDRSEPAR
jgi:hypothetical protein